VLAKGAVDPFEIFATGWRFVNWGVKNRAWGLKGQCKTGHAGSQAVMQ
jgi:hypothetical protein